MMSATIISVKGLSLIRGQRLLFKDVDFSLSEGEAIHLRGENGSGKTSLINILTGVLKPDKGTVTIPTGQLIYVGHQPAVKLELTVMENVRFNAAIFDGIKTNEQILHDVLEILGLQPFAHQVASKLSAGQQRRIALTRLWLSVCEHQTAKKLWLLDEPLNALDQTTIKLLQTHIDRHLSLGGAVIFTSHQALCLQHCVTSLHLGVESI